MQKTADGLKEGVQKTVFLNVSGIGCACTSPIVFFQKQEKVFVRVPNDLKCYENRDFTCLSAGTHHGRSPLQNLNLAGKLIWGNITLFNQTCHFALKKTYIFKILLFFQFCWMCLHGRVSVENIFFI